MAKKRAKKKGAKTRAQALFRAYVALLAVLTLFGLTRVSLSARVAEASVDLGELQSDIEAEMLLTDQLEIDKGVLLTPSRLENIASTSMCMAEPAEVTYIALAEAGVVAGPLLNDVSCRVVWVLDRASDRFDLLERWLRSLLGLGDCVYCSVEAQLRLVQCSELPASMQPGRPVAVTPRLFELTRRYVSCLPSCGDRCRERRGGFLSCR